jgi:hypothetical protein
MKVRDRREAKRISYICEVVCDGAGLNRFATRINNLSTAGAFIDSLTAASPGSRLKLKFRINHLTIETEAEVRYSMPQVGMGVRFVNLREDHLRALQCLVNGTPIEPAFPFNERPGATDQPIGGQCLLLGNFAVINIFDVIQMIENSRVTGSLLIHLPHISGAIHFNGGLIADARAGEYSGSEALSMLLDASEGTFEFKKAAAPFEPAIQATSNMGLILDLLRIKDEDAGTPETVDLPQ